MYCGCCFVSSSIDPSMWLTVLSTAALVVVIGSVVAMLVTAENRRAEELNQQRQPKYQQQAPRGSGSAEETR